MVGTQYTDTPKPVESPLLGLDFEKAVVNPNFFPGRSMNKWACIICALSITFSYIQPFAGTPTSVP